MDLFQLGVLLYSAWPHQITLGENNTTFSAPVDHSGKVFSKSFHQKKVYKVLLATVAKQGEVHTGDLRADVSIVLRTVINCVVDVVTHGWFWSSESKASVMAKLWLWYVCLNALRGLYNLRTTCFVSW